jgi:hypothetical protein
MTTVRNIVASALRKAQVLGAGEVLSATDGQDALEALSNMVDDWSNEELLIPVTSNITLPLLANVSDYTVGIASPATPTNHLETARPIEIKAAYIRDGAGTDYIQTIMGVKAWAGISNKGNVSRPSRFYVENGWPLITIRFESVPYADENLHMLVTQPLSGILPTATLNDVVDMPQGYVRALIYNLAMEIMPEYGKDVSSIIAVTATNSLRKIKRKNYQPSVLRVDNGLRSNNSGRGTYIIGSGP